MGAKTVLIDKNIISLAVRDGQTDLDRNLAKVAHQHGADARLAVSDILLAESVQGDGDGNPRRSARALWEIRDRVAVVVPFVDRLRGERRFCTPSGLGDAALDSERTRRLLSDLDSDAEALTRRLVEARALIEEPRNREDDSRNVLAWRELALRELPKTNHGAVMWNGTTSDELVIDWMPTILEYDVSDAFAGLYRQPSTHLHVLVTDAVAGTLLALPGVVKHSHSPQAARRNGAERSWAADRRYVFEALAVGNFHSEDRAAMRLFRVASAVAERWCASSSSRG